jgi:hypothetical protein
VKAALIVIGLATGGLALLYWRNKNAPPQLPSGDACDALCSAQSLATGITPELCRAGLAYKACKAAGGALGAVKDAITTDWARYDRENRELNGELETPLPVGVQQRVTVNGTGVQGLHGSATKFKNGCVPFEGAPGWEKCAPGTHSMVSSGGGLRTRRVNDIAATEPAELGRAFTRAGGDPLWQGPFTSDGLTPIDFKSPTGQTLTTSVPSKFDLPLAQGETGWIAEGVAFKCPAGTEPAWGVRDHRTGAPPAPCTKDGKSPYDGAIPPPVDTGSTQTVVACGANGEAPAGFTWDPTLGGFWRRPMVGESINPGPCASSTSSTDDRLVSRVLAAGSSRLGSF